MFKHFKKRVAGYFKWKPSE